MTTSASFLSLFWQLMTLPKYVNPPPWFHTFPPCEISVSPRALGVLFWILSVSWHRALSFILIYVTDILDDEDLLITCRKQLPHSPLSDGAHRHFPVNKVRARVTSLVTEVHASSNKTGIWFKAVAVRAGKLEGSFHTDVWFIGSVFWGHLSSHYHHWALKFSNYTNTVCLWFCLKRNGKHKDLSHK